MVPWVPQVRRFWGEGCKGGEGHEAGGSDTVGPSDKAAAGKLDLDVVGVKWEGEGPGKERD